MSKRRIIAIVSTFALVALMIAAGLMSAGAATGRTIRGVIGGDFHGVASAGGDDWGALATVWGAGAATRILDMDVAVVDNQAPAGVLSSDESDHGCSGTYQAPTAPRDKVCVYISNGDNAVDVHGVSVVPGVGGSRFGFKIVWSTPTDDADTFIEAVWAYNRPG